MYVHISFRHPLRRLIPRVPSDAFYVNEPIGSFMFILPAIPGVPSTGADCYHDEWFGLPQVYVDADRTRYDKTHPGYTGYRIDFPFEDIDANVSYERVSVFPGSVTPDQLLNTAMNENSLAPPMDTVVEPNLTPAPTATPQPQTPPAHKYQCFVCLKTHDRAIRLETCINQHFGVRPHGCFGACGSTGWCVVLRFVLSP
jgi:hypothetical protein